MAMIFCKRCRTVFWKFTSPLLRPMESVDVRKWNSFRSAMSLLALSICFCVGLIEKRRSNFSSPISSRKSLKNRSVAAMDKFAASKLSKENARKYLEWNNLLKMIMRRIDRCHRIFINSSNCWRRRCFIPHWPMRTFLYICWFNNQLTILIEFIGHISTG